MTQLDHAPSRFSPANGLTAPPPRLDVSYRFGLKMRELRHNRNWTQQQMANFLGIDRSYISEVERGRKAISLPMLEIVALGFGIHLSDLLTDI